MNTTLKYGFILLWTVIVGVLAFFILYNAGWLIGDDAIVIRHTGWGHPFSPSDTIKPASGRFYPFSYLIYNLLWIVGLSSAGAHFALHSLIFVILCVSAVLLGKKATFHNKGSVWQYVMITAMLLICIQRSYANFLDAYSTVWFAYTAVLLWCLCNVFVHKDKSRFAACMGLFIISYLCYCSENAFVFPLSYGVCGMVFSWKNNDRLDKLYYGGHILTAVIYLCLYFVVVYRYIENPYDGAHGEDISLMQNAVRQLLAQKVMWLGLLVLSIRLYKVLSGKELYEFWDNMILTGFAFFCGCAILKLNWTLYYSMASLFMLPAIVHYLVKYFGGKYAAGFILCLALFMGRKLPDTISTNQRARIETSEFVSILEKYYRVGYSFFWLSSYNTDEWTYDVDLLEWQRKALQTQMGRKVSDESFVIQHITMFDGTKGIYVLPFSDEEWYYDLKAEAESAGQIVVSRGGQGLTVVKVD